jgi:hypothetical protein
MSLDAPSLVAMLLLQCLQGAPDPAALGLAQSTLPEPLSNRSVGPVYRSQIGATRVYQFRTKPDIGETDNDCAIAVYDDDSPPYVAKTQALLENSPWKYSVVGHVKKAVDGVSEAFRLRGPGRSGSGLVIIFALPPNWRSMPYSSVIQPEVDYPTFVVFQGDKPLDQAPPSQSR